MFARNLCQHRYVKAFSSQVQGVFFALKYQQSAKATGRILEAYDSCPA